MSEEQAKEPSMRPGLNGIVPPVETRWKKGQSGNPKGRRAAGLSIVEWLNALQDAPEEKLERIARDKNEKPTKRAAAIEWLDRLAGGHDIADFEALCDGAMSLQALKAAGVPTRLLKKVKTRQSKRGVTREIELSDKGGQAIDRIIDRTIGKATQRNELTGADGGPLTVRIVMEDSPEAKLPEQE